MSGHKKHRLFQIIEPARSLDKISRYFDTTILILIILNVGAVILESFESLATDYQKLFQIFEIVSILIFTIEYGLRIYTSEYRYPQSKKLMAAIKYAKSPMAIIDLVAIIPFYIPFLLPIDLRFMRILRLTRTLRILKLNRYSKSLQLISRVLSKKKSDLLVTIFVTMLLIVFASSAMYYLETDIQPDQFPNIAASSWWAIATLTTVGYGDVYPVSILGKILSGVIALLGVGLVALPTGIISSGFIEEIQVAKNIRSSDVRQSVKTKKYNRTKSLMRVKKKQS